ncbi:hypothetical protein ACAG25_07390 [Mycobacterium sp. pV006]|uniref:hypothetical protein n=1 Tax=Mycobacterium sp. pV006 TaxID=3238983 RepID=UPI00351B684C
MARRAENPSVGQIGPDGIGPLYRALWDLEEKRHERFGRVGKMRRPPFLRDQFRRNEPVVVEGGMLPPGVLPRGSGGKHFVVTPDDRVREAVYGVDYGPVDTSI